MTGKNKPEEGQGIRVNYSEVEIYGERFTLKSNLEEHHLKAVAVYVDKKINEIKTATGVVSSSRVAILAALNIAEELFQLKEQKEVIENQVANKSSHLLELIEKCEKI